MILVEIFHDFGGFSATWTRIRLTKMKRIRIRNNAIVDGLDVRGAGSSPLSGSISPPYSEAAYSPAKVSSSNN